MFRSLLLASVALAATLSAAAAQTVPTDTANVELEPISVTANLTPTPTREVGSAVTIITREELEQRQIRLVSDALRSVPGVSVNRSGTAGNLTQVRIRGSESSHTLVLIDGIEINSPSSLDGDFDFAHLLALDVERIEVLRGPQSALYGSDAAGGVVNIVTRRGEGAPKASAFVEGGTRETLSGGASLSGSSGRFDYFLSAGGLRTQGFSSAAEWLGNSERDGYRNGTAFGKFGFQATDNLRFDVVGRAVKYRSENDAFGATAYDEDAHADGDQFFGRAQAKLDLFEGKWQQVIGASRTDQSYDYFEVPFEPSFYDAVRTKFDYRSSFFLRSDALPEITHTLTFGAEHEKDEAQVEGTYTNLDRTTEQTGLVAQYQIGLWDALFLGGSVRHDFNDSFEDVTTGRLTGAYNIDRTGTKLRASWGTGIKNPTAYEIFGTSGSFPILPNPDLKPELARGWDAGIDQSLFDDRLMIEATYFDQRIEDLIYNPFFPASQYVNLEGESPIHGIELGFTVRPVDGLSVRAAYTWTHSEDQNGERLLRRPEHTASLDADYAFLDGRALVGLGLVYTGDRDDTAFESDFTPYTATLDPYLLVNLRASYKVTDYAEIYGRLENLFDEEYEEAFSYGSPGRLAIIGARMSF